MPRHADLPAVFGKLCAQLQYVQQVSSVEYSSECPECGGVPHPDGEWPDRFRARVEDHPRCFCRRCGYFVWADQVNGEAPPTRADLDKFREIQVQREEARKRSAELALANLRSTQMWERYYNQLPGAGEDYWRKRGIPPSWQAYWWLGWQPDSYWNCPTATIPLFDANRDLLNIKHRLVGNDQQGQKYRYQLHGIPAPLWLADPEAPLTGHVIAIEGEIKAMVVKVTLDDKIAVVGLPGTNPGANVVAQLGQAERVTLVLDPGTDLPPRPDEPSPMQRLTADLGAKRTRVLIPQIKIDDMILAGKLSGRQVQSLLRQAR